MNCSRMDRLETVLFDRDASALLKRLSAEEVREVRFFQNGREVARVPGHWTGGDEGDLERVLREAGLDVDAVFDVELVMRGPGPGQRDVYRGGTVFVALNGPGFDARARGLLANRPGVVTFCVNNGAHGFRPDLWTCVDSPERFMGSIWRDGRVRKFVPEEFLDRRIGEGERAQRVSDCPNVEGFRRNEAFCAGSFLTEDSINWGNHKSRGGGRSVMLPALRIAYVLGFRRVVLVGCDFEMSAEKRYWFAEGRTKQAIANNMRTYGILEGFFTELLPVFAEAGFAVVNATPGSRLKAFPMVDLAEEVRTATAAVDLEATTEGMYQSGKSSGREKSGASS